MPSRTYSGINLINFILNDFSSHGSINGSSSVSVSEVSQMVVNGSGSANDSAGMAGSINAFSNVQYSAQGDFDYDQFPSIPDGATINSIRIRVAATASGSSSGSAVGGETVGAAASASCVLEMPIGNVLFPQLGFDDSESTSGASANASASGSTSFSTEYEEIFVVPITKAELILNWGNILVTMTGAGNCGNLGTGPLSSASATTSGSANLDNISVIIDYNDPSITMTLTPSGGNIEPGASITATGPGAADFEYAALNGDQVIPIIPKIIGPDEVVLEVPTPEPFCEDCFDDCPECEDCFDACNEDLVGEACQACLDACLDCLVECLDDLELGEACLGSADDDPDAPIPIVIICGTPGNQFTGSVPLGNFTIIVAEASGIYQLIDGKEEDTLYTPERDGTTYDVKIPNPNGKTGFFRS